MTVALVGAGPGDPELMTLRAEALLGIAAVVVSDAGVAGLVERFAPQARVVTVPDGEPAVAVLRAVLAAAERPVVRLYAGDPWLHPAHGLELASLHHAGIATEAVAGVTTELAVLAGAGIAVHVRHLAVVCTIGPVAEMPVAVDPARTLVVTGGDASGAKRLLAAGAANLPAASVPFDASGVVRGTLSTIGDQACVVASSLLVVGAVATAEVPR